MNEQRPKQFCENPPKKEFAQYGTESIKPGSNNETRERLPPPSNDRNVDAANQERNNYYYIPNMLIDQENEYISNISKGIGAELAKAADIDGVVARLSAKLLVDDYSDEDQDEELEIDNAHKPKKMQQRLQKHAENASRGVGPRENTIFTEADILNLLPLNDEQFIRYYQETLAEAEKISAIINELAEIKIKSSN